jgi:hypothetical protein
MAWIELTARDGQPIYVNTDRFDIMKWHEHNDGYSELKRLAGEEPGGILTVRERPEDIISLATGQKPRSAARRSPGIFT